MFRGCSIDSLPRSVPLGRLQRFEFVDLGFQLLDEISQKRYDGLSSGCELMPFDARLYRIAQNEENGCDMLHFGKVDDQEHVDVEKFFQMFEYGIAVRFHVAAFVTADRIGANAEHGPDDSFVDIGESPAQFVRLLAPLRNHADEMFVQGRINCFFHKT